VIYDGLQNATLAFPPRVYSSVIIVTTPCVGIFF